MSNVENRSHERRLRRLAERQELQLVKSRRRRPDAADYGNFWLVDPSINALIFPTGPGGQFGTDLDSIEEFLID